MQVSAQQFNAFNVVSLVQLLINRVCCICGASHRKKEYVLASSLLECQGHGYAVWELAVSFIE